MMNVIMNNYVMIDAVVGADDIFDPEWYCGRTEQKSTHHKFLAINKNRQTSIFLTDSV